MSIPAIPATHRDLLDLPIPVALATVSDDGRPQVTAVWAVREGDVVLISVLASRQKYRNLLARPQATLFVIDPDNPYRTLEIRGDIRIEADPELAGFAKVLAAYGSDLESFGGIREGRVLLTLCPQRVVAQ